MGSTHIGVLGCGWLGLPLTTSWISLGETVHASATTEHKVELLNGLGISSRRIDLTDIQPEELYRFLAVSVLVVTVPPRSRTQGADVYRSQIEKLVHAIEGSDSLEHIVYTSSTSVYKDEEGWVKEEDVQTFEQAGNQALFEVEQLFLSLPKKKTTVLRLGGLTGGSRMLARHFVGRVGIEGGSQPVNLVHLDDAVAAIQFVVKEGLEGVFNVCAPLHPSKKEFYTQLSAHFSLGTPDFKEETGSGKRVDVSKIERAGYQFKYPDPFLFAYDKS